MTDMHVVEDFEFSFCKERADDAIEVLKNSRGGLDGYNIAQYIGQFSNCRGWSRLSSSVRTTQIDALNKLARDYTETSLKNAIDQQVKGISGTVDVLKAFCDSNPDLIVSVKSNIFADIAMGYFNLVEGFWKGAESLLDGVLTAASLLVGWIPGVGDVLDAVIEFDIVGNTFDLLYEYHPAFKFVEKYSSWNHDDPSPAKLIKGAGTMIFYIAAAAATGGALAGAGVAGGAMTGLAGALGDGIITFVGTLGQNTEDALIADTTGDLSAFKAGWQNVDDALLAGTIAFGAGYILDGVSDYAGKQLKGVFSKAGAKAGTKAGSEAGQEALERITSDGLQEAFTSNSDNIVTTVIKNANGDNIVMDIAGEKLTGEAAEMTAEEFTQRAAQAGMSPEKFAQTLMDNGFEVSTEVLGKDAAGEIVTKQVVGEGFQNVTVDGAGNVVTNNMDNLLTSGADNMATNNFDNAVTNNMDNGFTRNMEDAFSNNFDDSFTDTMVDEMDNMVGGNSSSPTQNPTSQFKLTDSTQQLMGEGFENMTNKGLKAGTKDGLANLENKSLQNIAEQGKRLTPDDYGMTQGAWDDYIAQGFEPGTPDFDAAVKLDGTGTPPKVDMPSNRALTPDDYGMTQGAWDDYIAEGFEPGTPDFDAAVKLDGTGRIPGADDALPPVKPDVPTGKGGELVPYEPKLPANVGDDLVPPVKPDVPTGKGGDLVPYEPKLPVNVVDDVVPPVKPKILPHAAAIVTGNVVNNEIQPDPTLAPEDLDKVIPTAATPEPTGNTPEPIKPTPEPTSKGPVVPTPSPTPGGPTGTQPRVEHTTPPPPAITTPSPSPIVTVEPTSTPEPTTVVTTPGNTTSNPTTEPNTEDPKVKYCPKCHYPLSQCICGTGRGFVNEITPENPGDDDSLLNQIAGTKPGLEEIIDNTSGVNIPRSASPIKSSVNAKDNNMIPLMAGLGAAALAGLGTKVYLDRKENKDNEEELEAEEWDETEEEFEALENENYDLDLEESDYLTPNDEFAYQPDGVVAAVADDDEDEEDGEVYEAVNSSELSSMN